MILGLAPVDVAVIILYLVGITYIALRSSRSVKTSGDFFMGGRRFGRLSMTATAGAKGNVSLSRRGGLYFRGISFYIESSG
jgi:Na+/proline symporter